MDSLLYKKKLVYLILKCQYVSNASGFSMRGFRNRTKNSQIILIRYKFRIMLFLLIDLKENYQKLKLSSFWGSSGLQELIVDNICSELLPSIQGYLQVFQPNEQLLPLAFWICLQKCERGASLIIASTPCILHFAFFIHGSPRTICNSNILITCESVSELTIKHQRSTNADDMFWFWYAILLFIT